jgi:hypothetical protein
MENNFIECEVALNSRIEGKKNPALPSVFLLLFFIVSAFPGKVFSEPALKSIGLDKYEMRLADPSPLWILDSTVARVNFYHMLSSCGGNNTVFLKIENKNKYDIKIIWKENFLTQQLGYVEGFAAEKQLELKSEETAYASSCTDSKKEYIIFPQQVSPAYMAVILNYRFKEITVTRL